MQHLGHYLSTTRLQPRGRICKDYDVMKGGIVRLLIYSAKMRARILIARDFNTMEELL